MIYLIVFMLPLLINAQILITDLSDGINDQGISIKYIDGAKEPFKGFAFNYYPNGNKELKGSYNRGLKDGKWIWWYPNGEKYNVGYYVKSMEDSIWEWWFSNGQLMKRGKYKNGKKEGRWSEWYENGKLASSFGYMDDKPNGKCLKKYKNGFASGPDSKKSKINKNMVKNIEKKT